MWNYLASTILFPCPKLCISTSLSPNKKFNNSKHFVHNTQAALMVNTTLHLLEPAWTVQKTAPQVVPMVAPL